MARYEVNNDRSWFLILLIWLVNRGKKHSPTLISLLNQVSKLKIRLKHTFHIAYMRKPQFLETQKKLYLVCISYGFFFDFWAGNWVAFELWLASYGGDQSWLPWFLRERRWATSWLSSPFNLSFEINLSCILYSPEMELWSTAHFWSGLGWAQLMISVYMVGVQCHNNKLVCSAHFCCKRSTSHKLESSFLEFHSENWHESHRVQCDLVQRWQHTRSFLVSSVIQVDGNGDN